MAEPIGPGDWVEYRDNPEGCRARPARLVGPDACEGALYAVRAVMPLLEGLLGLRLEGTYAYHENGVEGWWDARHFRPIYRPKASVLERLKQPAPGLPARQPEKVA